MSLCACNEIINPFPRFAVEMAFSLATPVERVTEPVQSEQDKDVELLRRVAKQDRDAFAEFFFTPGYAGNAALAGGPISGRHIDQNIFEIRCFETFGDDFRRMLVREHELDGAVAGGGGGGKTIQKRDVLELKAEIGGKARHKRTV